MNTRRTVITALFTALTAVATVVIHIPVPATVGGYINAGDAIIYISAFLIGNPFAALASGIGSALSDIFYGAGVYILPTLVIKAGMGALCAAICFRAGFKRFIIACCAGGLLMAVGYGCFEWCFFGAAVALTSLPANLIQLAGGVVIACAIYPAAKRLSGKLSI